MKNKRLITAAVALVLVLVIAGGAYLKMNGGLLPDHAKLVKDSGDGVSDYSAVFLTNNQIYFGKVYEHGDNLLDLRDIYYLRVDQKDDGSASGSSGADTNQQSSTDNQNIVLVKLGDELHGPNDRMLINRDQVLFTESLKDGSKVVEAIKNYKK